MSVEYLEILPAKVVPSASALAAGQARYAVAAAGPTAAATVEFPISQAAASLDHLAKTIPSDRPPQVVADGLPDDVLHDAYFHVKRVEGDPAVLFVRMAVTARRILLTEAAAAPVRMAEPMLGVIDRAITDLFACAIGQSVGSLPTVTDWTCNGSRRQAMPRWIRGHQIFAALTQGLILSFQEMGQAVRAGDLGEVARWADLTVSLLRGSGASFVLTGDFSVQDYNDEIRPSMMPPASPICLSGLMSVDHRILVQIIRDIKPALKSLHDHDRSRYDQIHEELKTVYDRHIHVCERFVGDRPSLLTAGSNEKSGPALIEQFKALRLKAFESQNHVGRLPATPPARMCPIPLTDRSDHPVQQPKVTSL